MVLVVTNAKNATRLTATGGNGQSVLVPDIKHAGGVAQDGKVAAVTHRYALTAVPTEAHAPVLTIAVTAIAVTTHRAVTDADRLPTVEVCIAPVDIIRNVTTATVITAVMVLPTRIQ